MIHLGELLHVHAETQPDAVALRAPSGEQLRFGELLARVQEKAGGLAAGGLAPGAGVVVLQGMGIPLYELLLSLFYGGHTAILVDPSLGLWRLREALAAVRPQGLAGSPGAHLLRLAVPALRGVAHSFSTGWSLMPAARWERLSGPPLRAPVPAPGPALLTFTSGTTGAPAPFPRSHAFLLAQHAVLRAHMALGPGQVDMPTLPVFLLNSLAAGATAVLPDGDLRDVSRLDPARLVAQMRAAGVTTTSGSPAYLERLVQYLEARGETLGLDAVFVGGARVSARLGARLCAAFPRARIEGIYGSTEAEPIATLDLRESGAALADGERVGAGTLVGRPVQGIEVRIADPQGRAAEEGEVWVSGAHVNTYPAPGRQDKVVEGGKVWHRTGDAARRDPEGRLWLLGRIGENIGDFYPFPVETAAEAVVGVRRAALVRWAGEAWVVYSGEASPEAVGAATRLPAHSVAEIPVDPRHRAKVDRRTLARRLGKHPPRR